MKKSLVDLYDELIVQEKILFQGGLEDLDITHHLAEALSSSRLKSGDKEEDHSQKLDEANQMILRLEQQVRVLTIQLEEEKHANVDLEIENTKLKKQNANLMTSLESINNNCYDDESLLQDSKLDRFIDLELGADVTLVEESEADEKDDMSLTPILGDVTMMKNSFLGPAPPTPSLLFPPSLMKPRKMRQVEDNPSSKSACQGSKVPSDTQVVTPRPAITAPANTSVFTFSSETFTMKSSRTSETYTKISRRRSKSVDFGAGDKTMIIPQTCNQCSSQAREQRSEDSPTLPWCTHDTAQPQTSLNVTPARNLLLKRKSYLTSTPLFLKKV